MTMSNHERVGQGLERLKSGLGPYILRELKAQYKGDWWVRGIEAALDRSLYINAPPGTSPEGRFPLLDIQALLGVMWHNWNDVFNYKLGHTGRSYVSELREVRNRWAHQQPFSVEDAYRALDTMTRLLQAVSSEEAQDVERLARQLLRLRFEEEAKREVKKEAQTAIGTGTLAGLKPWREVIIPHPDVASGRYEQAEFAADLAAVLRKEGDEEYREPVEFFRRTYLTEGLTQLLVTAVRRLAGMGGDPVVELQTSFGGGKTHTMLALYHLVGGEAKASALPGAETILEKAGVEALPVARRAVLVGTAFEAGKVHPKEDGVVVHTLWGEMAYQLGGAAGYAMVADNDQHGLAPGSDTLKELFDKFGPCLVLVDEWVAFARNIYGVSGQPVGSFDANMTFAQSLTEGAKRSRNAIVVASIPASDIEIGGEGGKAALERLQNTFGRLEMVWKPASSEESFEIVRRRLFQSVTDFAARDAVVAAFMQMYREQRGDFPRECAEADYERRLKAAYPIHPELFDRLYQDWSTLEKFQRTRGVLRLMAAVIHELWEKQDKSLLIMPGTIPLDNSAVRYEMTRYLPEGWAAVVDTDVDGSASRPLSLDRGNPNLGRYSASRRVARTVFTGSAPSVAAQKVRGLEEVRVKLGCVQPGEATATFADALHRLSEQLTYLYSDGSRYWYDTRPSVNRLAADRASQFPADKVEDEIIQILRQDRERGEFAGIHRAPSSPVDVPDEDRARLVVLSPAYAHEPKNSASPAIEEALRILENRGTSPRQYRNMLVFLAPDKDRLQELEVAVRQWLAWTSVKEEEEELNLDAFQRRQVATNLERAAGAIKARLQETYIWLLVPVQQGNGTLEWDKSRINSGPEGYVVRAAKKLIGSSQLIVKWSPQWLRMELDRWLWKDKEHLSVKQLWEYLASYCYLSRLRDQEVLLQAIRDGLPSEDEFAYASNVDDQGHYKGLHLGNLGVPNPVVHMDGLSLLVKPEVALKQLKAARPSPEAASAGTDTVGSATQPAPTEGSGGQAGLPFPPQPASLPRRFYGSVAIDPLRANRDIGKIAEEVLQHLTSQVNAKVEVVLEIRAEVPDGFSDQIMRTVNENCRTLKFKGFGFEEE